MDATARAAIAQAEDEARIADARRSMVDTSSTGAEPSSAAPQVEAGLTSAQFIRWAELMEVEVSRFKGAIDTKVNELAASVSSTRDGVAAFAAQSTHLEVAFQQFVDNHADRVLTSRNDGDARERPRQKAQMSEDTMRWKEVSTVRKRWVIRGRIPPNLDDRPADLQSFVGEAIHVTAKVDDQLRSVRKIDVGLYGLRVDSAVEALLVVADRLDLLRLTVVAVLSVRLSPEISDDRLCLDRVSVLSDAFAAVIYKLRLHTLCIHGMLAHDGARRVMVDMVDTDLRLWVNDLMLAVQQASLVVQASPVVVPLPSGTMFDMPPLPAFDRSLDVCRDGGDVLKLIVSQAHGKGGESSKRKALNSPAGSSGVKSRAKPSAVCRMFSS